MSKYTPFIFAGVGSAATTVGGVYLIQGTSSGAKSPSTAEIQKLSADLNFTDLTSFKADAEGACGKKYFRPDLDFDSKGESIDGSHQIESTYFSSEANGASESCLVINWERKDADTGNKWSGNFKWLWSLKKGNKGMIMVGFLKPSETANQMSLESGIYFLEKEGTPDPKRWTIKKHKELTTAKSVGQNDFDGHFPKAGITITGGLNIADTGKKDYWGFSSGPTDLTNVCKPGGAEGTCPKEGTAPKTFKGSWLWTQKTVVTDTVDKWSSNLSSQLKTIYGDTGFGLDTSSFGSITGAWSQETPEVSRQNAGS